MNINKSVKRGEYLHDYLVTKHINLTELGISYWETRSSKIRMINKPDTVCNLSYMKWGYIKEFGVDQCHSEKDF